MVLPLTKDHQDRIVEIRKKLLDLGSREYAFVEVEILFYEVIAIARSYGDDLYENSLLASLKHLEVSEYRSTQSFFRKSNQREAAIRKFITRFRNILSLKEFPKPVFVT